MARHLFLTLHLKSTGTRIYLEIVGFWTKEYLEKKIQKIADLTKTIPAGNNAVDFFIAYK